MKPDAPCRCAPVLAIFAREPLAGQVKTRLAAALGATAAAAAYRGLIDATFSYAVAARAEGVVSSIELWCTPDADAPYFLGLATRHGVTLHAQRGDDLGTRMAAAIATVLTRASGVLLIGTDCPALGVRGLATSATLLRGHDAVLVPAEDGGFVLVGARVPIGFDDVRWSSEHTLRDTRAAFERAQLRWKEAPVCWDVDERADFERWERLRDLKESSRPP